MVRNRFINKKKFEHKLKPPSFLFLESSESELKLQKALENAAKIIPNVWPLQTFIATNPLHGMEFLKFDDAVALADKFFIENQYGEEKNCKESDLINLVNRELIKWCHAFLDEGQATIVMPGKEKGFYQAWVSLLPFDKNLFGKSSQKPDWISLLPSKAEKALVFCLNKLGISSDEWEDYLRGLLSHLPGWAGYIKWKSIWPNKKTDPKNPITLFDFLAVRLVMTCLMSERQPVKSFNKEYFVKKSNRHLNLEKIKAAEDAYRESLLKAILPTVKKIGQTQRADAQLIFCIDVRSEPMRKEIESQGNYETFGFAGFFGLPVCLHDYHNGKARQSCPVLLKSQHDVYEQPSERCRHLIHRANRGRKIFDMMRSFYQDLKYNFATPFALVETLGLWCGLWMGMRTLAPCLSANLKKQFRKWLMPNLMTEPIIQSDSEQGGISLRDQVFYAESALNMIGLRENFAKLLVLCGHGSATENNPYASALDCGACGGNHGGPNAKILAAILNNPDVRTCLKQKGIEIPDDTLCIAAEHNTTTDEVTIYVETAKNESHEKLLEQLKADLAKASHANSKKRYLQFDSSTPSFAKNQILKRSSDWAELRPEWGLARNAGFIVGPRSLTKHLDLQGRCFLHSYDWTKDQSGKSLETILTAPMVVAEWINMQYFFSTIDNVTYGSGSKLTHNVVGKFGIMQGNASDLMHGLPLQSVNSADNQKYHEPIRLQVVIYAPRAMVESVIGKHEILKTLFFNNWVGLVLIDPRDHKPYRLINPGQQMQSFYFNELNLNFERSQSSLRPTHTLANHAL